jgi:hypothetical protein
MQRGRVPYKKACVNPELPAQLKLLNHSLSSGLLFSARSMASMYVTGDLIPDDPICVLRAQASPSWDQIENGNLCSIAKMT